MRVIHVLCPIFLLKFDKSTTENYLPGYQNTHKIWQNDVLNMTIFWFQVAAIFLFNLLVGVGVLALPAAIAKAGIIAGILCLTTVSFMAFISITFMIEVLATANAWRGTKPVTRKGQMKGCDTEIVALGETSQIKVKTDVLSPPLFDIEEKFEMGYMSEMFLGAAGSTFFYAVLCLYLYGVSTVPRIIFSDF